VDLLSNGPVGRSGNVGAAGLIGYRPSVSCRLVICDDYATLRAVLVIAFSAEPEIEVVGEAASGIEAIEVVRREQPDVLLLDVAMPDMDGLEALPHVLDASPGTRVVVLTGFSNEALKERLLAEGASLCLEKGLTPQELAAAILELPVAA
jgi:DNA-binding NarL/FixJ family response regulator